MINCPHTGKPCYLRVCVLDPKTNTLVFCRERQEFLAMQGDKRSDLLMEPLRGFKGLRSVRTGQGYFNRYKAIYEALDKLTDEEAKRLVKAIVLILQENIDRY